jgi:hypothetical protein
MPVMVLVSVSVKVVPLKLKSAVAETGVLAIRVDSKEN